MENIKELAELLLPQGILDYFNYKSYETENGRIINYFENRAINPVGFKKDK